MLTLFVKSLSASKTNELTFIVMVYFSSPLRVFVHMFFVHFRHAPLQPS